MKIRHDDTYWARHRLVGRFGLVHVVTLAPRTVVTQGWMYIADKRVFMHRRVER